MVDCVHYSTDAGELQLVPILTLSPTQTEVQRLRQSCSGSADSLTSETAAQLATTLSRRLRLRDRDRLNVVTPPIAIYWLRRNVFFRRSQTTSVWVNLMISTFIRRVAVNRGWAVLHCRSCKRTEVENPTVLAFQAFRRRTGRMGKQEREEYDRKMDQKSPPDLTEALNTPGRTEI